MHGLLIFFMLLNLVLLPNLLLELPPHLILHVLHFKVFLDLFVLVEFDIAGSRRPFWFDWSCIGLRRIASA